MKKIVEVVLHLIFWFLYLFMMPYTGYMTMMKNGYPQDLHFYKFWISHEPINTNPPLVVLLLCFDILYFITSYSLHQKKTVRAFVYLGWSILITIPMGMVLLGTQEYVAFHVLPTYYFIVLSTAGIFAAAIKGIILWMVDISEKRVLQKRQLESENAL